MSYNDYLTNNCRRKVKAAEGAGGLLQQLHHSQITLREVVVERDREVAHEGEDAVGVVPESVARSSAGGAARQSVAGGIDRRLDRQQMVDHRLGPLLVLLLPQEDQFAQEVRAYESVVAVVLEVGVKRSRGRRGPGSRAGCWRRSRLSAWRPPPSTGESSRANLQSIHAAASGSVRQTANACS